MVRKQATFAAVVLLVCSLVTTPVAAHGARTGTHDHTLPIVVFLGSVAVLGGSLVADHFDLLDRSMADVGVVGGGVGIVLSVGLLWL